MSKPLSRFNHWFIARPWNRRRPRTVAAWVGLEALENRALLSAGPTITSITGNPDPAIRSAPLTITANGITDTGGLIRSVTFYLDVNGDGIFDHGDKRLGNGKLVQPNSYAINVHTSKWALGTNLILAVATDSNGNQNAPFERSVVIDNRPPHIGKLEVVHKIAAAGNSVKLEALDITDPDAKIQSVAFFLDSNNNGVPDSGELLGVDSNKQGGWTFTGNMPVTLPTTGTVTFLAVATGTDGTAGTLATVTVPVDAPPTITTGLAADADVIARSVPVTLTASGVTDSDGKVSKVTFFFDANHDGVLDAGDKSLGNGKREVVTTTPATGTTPAVTATNYVLTTKLSASTPTGPATFFAVAVDNKGATGITGDTTTAQVTVGPAIGSLTSAASTVALGGSVQITANNVVTVSGKTITGVEFFADANGNEIFDPSDRDLGAGTLVGAGTVAGSGNYQFTYLAPQDTTLIGVTLFAVATDNSGGNVARSSPVSVPVAYAPEILSFTATPSPLALGGTLTLTATAKSVRAASVSGIKFFYDSNGTGVFDSSTDPNVGAGTLQADGSYQATVTIPTSLATGSNTFFAQATDSDNFTSPAASAQVILLPSIGALAPNSPTVVPGDTVTLTASAIAVGSNGTVGSIEFFYDSNGNNVFDPSSDTDIGAGIPTGTGNYQQTFTIPQNTAGKSATFFAVLTDSDTPPNTSPTASVQVALILPTISTLTPSVTTAAPGDSVTLTAAGILVGTGTVQNVEFFIDTNNNGVFDPGTDMSIGTGTLAPDGSSYSFLYALPQDTPAGKTTFFAVVTNANNISGPAAAAQVQVTVS